MKITASVTTNLKTKEAQSKVHKAGAEGLRDAITAIANDAIHGSPVLTGNNRRSIKFEVGSGEVAKSELEAATYSTSGYGGFLETGTARMPARSYFKPALDKNAKNLPNNIKGHIS